MYNFNPLTFLPLTTPKNLSLDNLIYSPSSAIQSVKVSTLTGKLRQLTSSLSLRVKDQWCWLTLLSLQQSCRNSSLSYLVFGFFGDKRTLTLLFFIEVHFEAVI